MIEFSMYMRIENNKLRFLIYVVDVCFVLEFFLDVEFDYFWWCC